MKVPCGGFDLDESVFNVDKNSKKVKLNSPISYDYMPEGYPSKSIEAVTLMEEQVVEFVSSGDGLPNIGTPTTTFTPVEGQTYIVNWDGTEYECVCSIFNGRYLAIGNLSIMGAGDDTGEPFIYINVPSMGSEFETLDTASSHTISVKKTGEIFTTIAEEFLPVASGENYGVVKKDEIVTAYVFPSLAPQVEMNKAVDDFMAGKAKITWGKDNIIFASRSSDTEIIIRTSKDPVNSYKYTVDERRHAYDKGSVAELSSSEISVRRIYITTEDGTDHVGPITGVNNPNVVGNEYIEYGYTRIYEDGIAIKSSDSTKMFKITVNDSGTISATEVT